MSLFQSEFFHFKIIRQYQCFSIVPVVIPYDQQSRCLPYLFDLWHFDVIEHLLYDILGGDPLRFRFVGDDDPVP